MDENERCILSVGIIQARRHAARGGFDRPLRGGDPADFGAPGGERGILVDPQTEAMEFEHAIVQREFLFRLDRAHFVRQIRRDNTVGSAESMPFNEKRHRILRKNPDIRPGGC
jgi:hypothetical protein